MNARVEQLIRGYERLVCSYFRIDHSNARRDEFRAKCACALFALTAISVTLLALGRPS